MSSLLQNHRKSSVRRASTDQSLQPAVNGSEAMLGHSMLAAHRPPVHREQLVAEMAYRHAESRGFAPGHELDDWLSAEAEVNEQVWAEGRIF
jgi:hypothetical protein